MVVYVAAVFVSLLLPPPEPPPQYRRPSQPPQVELRSPYQAIEPGLNRQRGYISDPASDLLDRVRDTHQYPQPSAMDLINRDRDRQDILDRNAREALERAKSPNGGTAPIRSDADTLTFDRLAAADIAPYELMQKQIAAAVDEHVGTVRRLENSVADSQTVDRAVAQSRAELDQKIAEILRRFTVSQRQPATRPATQSSQKP